MIIVFGSINIDQVYKMDAMPRAGETVHGNSYFQVPGGKGANQALAAKRAGANVSMIGCVGDDANADPALSLMLEDHVSLDAIVAVTDPTGCASIWVDGNGENSIAVVSGANALLKETQVTDEALSNAKFLLMQMEVPAVENWSVLARAKNSGVKTLLNLAPISSVPVSVFEDLDYLVVNEVEAAFVAEQFDMDGLSGSALAQGISEKFDLCCVLTLGGAGAVAAEDGQTFEAKPMDINPVDTTAAGDSFIGGFAAALSEGKALSDALQFATITAGLTCLGDGAQSSLPYRDKIDEVLKTL